MPLPLGRRVCGKYRDSDRHSLPGSSIAPGLAVVSSCTKLGVSKISWPGKFSLSKPLDAESCIDQLLIVKTFKVQKYYGICHITQGLNASN